MLNSTCTWVRGASGVAMLETSLLLLVVKQVSGSMRFLIFARRARGAWPLIRSGTKRSAALAMSAAEAMASNYERLVAPDGRATTSKLAWLGTA